MKTACSLIVVLCIASTCFGQANSTGQTVLTAKSTLVLVPVFVKDGAGEPVFNLKAQDFVLTDNGVRQSPMLELETDSEPLALVIVVEMGGAGALHLADFQGLASILDALIGGVEHRVAVVGFDTTPHLVVPFTSKTDDAADALATLSSGDQGASILDAIVFAIEQLRAQPPNYRRTILLLSETIDQGSQTSLSDALHLISDTNTTIYSFGFSSTRSAVSHEASKVSSGQSGPARGCFSRAGADPEYEGHYNKQVLDCISQLAPPLRLATMAFLTARNTLRTNTAQSLAELTGGKFMPFHDAKDLKARLIALSNDIANYYVLSFRPSNPTSGLHALHVSAPRRSRLTAEFRREYWIDESAKSISPQTPAK
jgi:VWFA-related protein